MRIIIYKEYIYLEKKMSIKSYKMLIQLQF
jgi:hypothetical protein